MNPSAEDFYVLFTNHKFKKVSETIQDGFAGMYFVLRKLDEADTKLSAGDISEMFGVSTPRTAVILATLKRKGFITKTKASLDARKTIVEITDAGRRALASRRDNVFSTIDNMLNKLSSDERISLYSTLHKLVEG